MEILTSGHSSVHRQTWNVMPGRGLGAASIPSRHGHIQVYVKGCPPSIERKGAWEIAAVPPFLRRAVTVQSNSFDEVSFLRRCVNSTCLQITLVWPANAGRHVLESRGPRRSHSTCQSFSDILTLKEQRDALEQQPCTFQGSSEP